MQGYEYPNLKMKFIAKIFGPLSGYLVSLNISPMFIGVIVLGLYNYFFILRNRAKTKKYRPIEKFAIIAWYYGLILSIISQIIMIVRKG